MYRHRERWDPRSTATLEFGKPTALRGKRSANAPRHQPAPDQPRPPVFPVITSAPPAAEPQRSHEWEWAQHFLTGAHMPIPRVSDLNENSSFEPSLSATNIQSSGQTPRESLLATCTVGLYTVRIRARGFRGSDAAPCSPRASRPNTRARLRQHTG